MRKSLAPGAIAAGAVIMLAGCSTGPGATQESNPPSPTQVASPIPPVKQPRDVSAMAQRPCELLTAQQATAFGLDLPPTQTDGLSGTQRCEWTHTSRDQRTIRTINVGMFTNNPTLEVAYSKDRGRPFFDLTEIVGYPSIVSRTNADLPICDIDIKLAERQSVSVTYESKEFQSNPQRSCEVGKQVAAAVLMNFPLKS